MFGGVEILASLGCTFSMEPYASEDAKDISNNE
jgi:hypothetical protein